MKRWPENHQLLSWLLFSTVEDYNLGDKQLTPQHFSEVLLYFGQRTAREIHAYLYENYEDFRKEFLPPDYGQLIGPKQ